MKENVKNFDDFYYKGKKYSLTEQMFIYRNTSHHDNVKFIFYIPEIMRFVSLNVDKRLRIYKDNHQTMAEFFEQVIIDDRDHPLYLSLLIEKSNFKFECNKYLYFKQDLVDSYEKNLNCHWKNLKKEILK